MSKSKPSVHVLRRGVLDPQIEVSISSETFQSLQQARATLVDGHSFEARFDLLKENYIALELAAATWALRATVGRGHSYVELSTVLQDANRHVINLLTAARTYLDQTAQEFKHLPVVGFRAGAKALRAAAFDACAEYRFMEALRNHAQHRGGPVHGFTHTDQGAHWADCMVVYAEKAKLAEDEGFKAAVLKELPPRVDIRLAARRYIEHLSKVHLGLRTLVKGELALARRSVEQWTKRYLDAGNESAIGLTAIQRGGETSADPVPLLLDWDDVRAQLATINSRAIRVR